MIQTSTGMPQLNAQMFGQVVYNPTQFYQITSREPQLALCPYCHKYVQTRVAYEVGTGTLISSGFLACIGALACFWVPCCIKDFKDAVHYCPSCNNRVGAVKFMAK